MPADRAACAHTGPTHAATAVVLNASAQVGAEAELVGEREEAIDRGRRGERDRVDAMLRNRAHQRVRGLLVVGSGPPVRLHGDDVRTLLPEKLVEGSTIVAEARDHDRRVAQRQRFERGAYTVHALVVRYSPHVEADGLRCGCCFRTARDQAGGAEDPQQLGVETEALCRVDPRAQTDRRRHHAVPRRQGEDRLRGGEHRLVCAGVLRADHRTEQHLRAAVTQQLRLFSGPPIRGDPDDEALERPE